MLQGIIFQQSSFPEQTGRDQERVAAKSSGNFTGVWPHPWSDRLLPKDKHSPTFEGDNYTLQGFKQKNKSCTSILIQDITPCLGEGAVNVTLTRAKCMSLHCNGGPSPWLTTHQYILSHLKNKTPGDPILTPSSCSYALPPASFSTPSTSLSSRPQHPAMPSWAAFLHPHRALTKARLLAVARPFKD